MNLNMTVIFSAVLQYLKYNRVHSFKLLQEESIKYNNTHNK